MTKLLGSLLLLTTACAIDGTEQLGTTDQDLVGAYTTQTRPEIGMVFIGGACTGTLISDRVVLTAAHCLSPAYTGTTAPGAPAPAGSVFQFVDASGIWRTYPLDYTHSFHPEGDVAIVHLRYAVPSSQAVPATISPTPPNVGDTSTTYGFGCNSSAGTGAGVKRSSLFAYGQQTARLCAADSGGPVTFGYTGGSGSIWGLNVSGSPDRFAMVSYLLPEISALKRQWDGNADVGIDRPGMDYDESITANAEACNARCDSDGRCKAWSYVPSTFACFLKDGVPDQVTVPGVTSGLVRIEEIGYDRPGNDREVDAFTGDAGAAACLRSCERDYIWCRAWSYVPSTHQCWKKDAIPPRVPNPNVTSGLSDRELVTGYDRPGGDLRQVHADEAGACGWQCAKDVTCKAFVWSATRTVPGTSNNCWLKNEVTSPVEGPEFTSAVRGGAIVGKYTTGLVATSFTITDTLWPQVYTNSPSSTSIYQCQAACDADTFCNAWNVQLDSNDGATCSLIHTVAAQGYDPRSVTGFRDTEFMP